MRISGDVYSARTFVVYNDAAGLALDTAGEYDAFVARALEEGWRAENSEHGREDWWDEYSKEVEAEDEASGLFDTGGAAIVQPAKLDADRLLLAELIVDKRYRGEGFGRDLVQHNATVAVNGWQDAHMVTCVFESGKLAARIQNPVPRTPQSLALADEWLLLGMGGAGGVMLVRRQAGRWAYSGWLSRTQSGAQSGFGDAVAASGTWAAVSAGQPAAVHFYQLRGDVWSWAQSVPVESPAAIEALAMSDGLTAAGQPRRFGGSGCVEVIAFRQGSWQREQTVALAERRLGDGLGRSVEFEGGALLAKSERGWWKFPLRNGWQTG
jgi:GNAT superfamily N-acetyltransferase